MDTAITIKSNQTKASIQSQQTIDNVSQKSQQKLYKLQVNLDEETINNAWAAFGTYVCKCLRQGRAVSIPKFGLFTYSFRDVNLDGTTNEYERDKEEREPVFIISKDFAKGLNIKSGVYRLGGIIRPLVLSSTSGKIQQTLCSYQEIASISQLNKEEVKYSVERIIRRIEDQIRNGDEQVYMFIPSLGLFMYKKGITCVKFQDFIKKDIKGLLKLNVSDRKKKNQSDLTSEKLKQLSQSYYKSQNNQEEENYQTTQIQEDAEQYLKNNLQIDPSQIIEEGRTPNNQEELSNKLQQILASSTNDTIKLSTARDSYSKQTNRSITVIQSEEEIAFQKLNYLLRNKCIKPYDLLSTMLGYIYGINSTDRKTLTLEQFMKALHKQDIEMESDEEYSLVFSYIDSKRDKKIDLEEWQNAFSKKESQSLEYLKDIIMRNNIVIDDFFKTMGLNRDTEQITLKEFKNGLKKINISKYISDLAAAEIFEDKQSLPPQQIIDKLTADRKNLKNLTNLQNTARTGTSGQNDIDDSDTSLLLQIYRKIKQELINKYPEEKQDRHDKYLIQEFEKLDQQSQGSLDIANFKTCLMKANLNLTLNEVVRIARYIEKNQKGQIDYCKFSKKVNNSLRMSDEIESLPYLVEMIKKYMQQNKMNSEEFITHLLENKENRKTFNIQDKKKVRIPVFAQMIAKKINFNLQESIIQQNCELIDIDRDGYIDKFDLETFLSRYYYIEDQISKKTSFASQVFSKSHTGNFFSMSKSNGIGSTIKSKQQLTSSLLNITKSQLVNQPIRLYPTDNLPLEKLEVILRDLKQNAGLRRLSYYEIFKILDVNNDGFVSFNEFEEKIDSFVKLSSHAKEGLFSYFDHLKIGMFDFPRFASILSRITLKNHDDKQIDNWEWQHSIIRQIKEWKETNGFTEEEAFRIIDCDFDGFISIDDLKKFLSRDFKLREEHLDSTKLDRLFKLFDQYKKGYIQKHDFAKIFTNQFEEQLSNGFKTTKNITYNDSFFKKPEDQLSKNTSNIKAFTQTPKSVPNIQVKELSKTLTFLKPKKQLHNGNTLNIEDWMINCCQQIALVVSSKYKDLVEAFEKISNHSQKIEYQKLNDWILQTNALFGFNLTETLLQQLFAYMDPHKKGYITQDDWVECLKIYTESKDIPLSDLTDLIYFSFKSNDEAFRFFLFGQKFEKQDFKNTQSTSTTSEVSLHKFKFALNNLYKQVYSDKIVEKLWIAIHQFLKIPVEQQLTLEHFNKLFPRINNQNSRYNRTSSNTRIRVANIDSLRFSDQFKSNSLSCNNLISYNNFTLHDDIINKFKNLILSKGKDIESIFKQHDTNNTGFISNTEFKNILMRLNIGLNGRDMDYILIFADPSSPAEINWKKFMKKLQFSSSQQNLINRSKKRINHLKECLYSYLISPKDAFREFDEEKKGYMTLEDFRYFLVKVSKLDRSEIPSFAISKDMFDQIDLKKDGLIDLDEWIQAFMNYGGTEEHDKIIQEKEKDKFTFCQFHKKKLDILNSIIDQKKKQQLQDKQADTNSQQQNSTSLSRNNSVSLVNGSTKQNVIDIIKNNSSIPLSWEKSQDYDKAISLIARNRRYLIQKFEALYEQQHGKDKRDGLDKYLSVEAIKQVLWEFLTSHNIHPSQFNLSVLYNFAAQKNGLINYNFMIDVFKSRLDQINNPPKNS
ncbi:EF-hand protein (macronuclear) [Tetrahymena thermophila SB210]|uniref:EF-hand protein n=1 Tax=Tetrahymena thermophila (strain SB210) TaxID=312017 RepID=Q23D77_TETTS|nr:EF-hand protein [Tetrahymena thermophila SB210]EAR94641.2 EF-hand protein [Tetrahymena thermophila SB210]|eukprot:XP_001014809.2 EF-hand protein [Tetrahymena thermophila SB210]